MRLALEDDELVISLSLAERIMATKCGDVLVPLAEITSVECEQTAWAPIGINMGRVHIPGRIHFGTVLTRHGKQFWATRRKQEHLVLHLKRRSVRETGHPRLRQR